MSSTHIRIFRMGVRVRVSPVHYEKQNNVRHPCCVTRNCCCYRRQGLKTEGKFIGSKHLKKHNNSKMFQYASCNIQLIAAR